MKKLILLVITVAAYSVGPLLAQDLTGSWQGTLQAGQPLRIVMKIAKADGGASGFKANMYSIDQGGAPIVATVTLQTPSVKIAVPAIEGLYDGKLDGDQASMTGTWSQRGGPAISLTLVRATNETAWDIPAPPVPLKPMTDANPSFEAATIKPTKPGAQGKGIGVRGRNMNVVNYSLTDLIAFAWNAQYLAEPGSKRGIPKEAWQDSLDRMMAGVQIIRQEELATVESEARARIGARDIDDWPAIAAALQFDCPVWTEDQDFFGSGIATWATATVEIFLDAR